MPLTHSILALITDGTGRANTDFLSSRAEDWARQHMMLRYGASPPLPDDAAGHPARLAWDHLLREHSAVKQWFGSDGKLSPLLMSRCLARELSGPLGDGFGWDFKASGDPESRMLQFKGTLLACVRVGELKPGSKKLDCGSHELSGLAKMVRSAYLSRAELHNWPATTEANGSMLQGADLARRWVSLRTYNFLLRFGAEDEWAWGVSRCHEAFGPADVTRA